METAELSSNVKMWYIREPTLRSSRQNQVYTVYNARLIYIKRTVLRSITLTKVTRRGAIITFD